MVLKPIALCVELGHPGVFSKALHYTPTHFRMLIESKHHSTATVPVRMPACAALTLQVLLDPSMTKAKDKNQREMKQGLEKASTLKVCDTDCAFQQNN